MRRGGGWWYEVLVAVLLLAAAPHATRAQDDAGVVRGCVLDEHGRAIEGVTVALVDWDRWTVDDLAAQEVARTGADGRYVARLAAAWVADVERDDRALVFAGHGLATVVQALALQRGPRLDVCLFPGVTALVRVLDRQGAPLAGVRVTGRQPDPVREIALRQPCVAGRSDARGRVELVGAAPESLVFRIHEPGYAVTQTLPAAWRGPVDLETEWLGFVSGQLVDPATGAPRREAGRLVFCTGPMGRLRSTETDAEGRFRVARASADPQVLFTDMANETGDPAHCVTIPAGSEQTVDLPAPPTWAQRLAGVVVRVVDDVAGGAVAGAEVAWIDAKPEWAANELIRRRPKSRDWLPCDAEGRFRPTDLGNRIYQRGGTLVVRAPGRAIEWSVAIPPDIGPGDEREFEVRMRPAPAFECVVREAGTGRPLAGQLVALLPDEGLAEGGSPPRIEDVHWQARSDAEGRVRIDALCEGYWYVLVKGSDYQLEGMPGVYVLDQEIDAPPVLELSRLSSVSLSTDGGEGLPEAVVLELHRPFGPFRSVAQAQLIESPSSSRLVAAPRAAGLVRFEGLDGGRHELEAVLPPMARGGGVGRVPLGELVVGEADEPPTIDLRKAAPALLRGRIRFGRHEPTPGRLAVVAQQLRSAAGELWVLTEFGSGPYRYLDSDGSFALRLAPGSWRVSLVDSVTGSHQVLEAELRLAPAARHDLATTVAWGAVRIRFGSSPDLPGHFGHRLSIRPLLDPQLPGVPLFGRGSSEFEREIRLAGEPGEWVVSMPCEEHSLSLQRFSPAWRRALVQEDLPEEIGDETVRITPRAGQTLDVDLGLPRDGR